MTDNAFINRIYAGYMPSDLYNLNSSYGSVEELKYCIDEMHSQDLLVSGAANFEPSNSRRRIIGN